MSTEIAMPFRLDGNGRVVGVTDPDAQVHQHVIALLSTIPAERAMVPGYGTNLIGLVFNDPDGDAVAESASIMIKQAMATWEPGVGLVRAAADADRSQDDMAIIDVEFRRLDAADSGTAVNANMAVIGANGAVREIVRG